MSNNQSDKKWSGEENACWVNKPNNQVKIETDHILLQDKQVVIIHVQIRATGQ